MISDKLTFFSKRIQYELIPILESELNDPLLDKHYKVSTMLELIQIERFIPSFFQSKPGRPPKSRINIARAFLAKHILNISTTSHMIHMLKVDKNLRYICGWIPGERIPSESTFSRVFSEMSHSKVLEQVHEKLVKDTYQDHLVIHNARDSMPIPVREREKKDLDKKPKYERYTKTDKSGKKISLSEYQALELEPLDKLKADLPKKCNVGRKRKPDGLSICWRGYKLHMDVADGKFPISCILTSASTHDSQAAIPLSMMSSSRANVLYELMDSAYDVNAIKDYIKKKGRVPLVKFHKRKGKRKQFVEGNALATKVLNWKPADEKRLQHRFCNERLFARLKDSFLGNCIYVREHSKVMCHVMLGVLSLFACELLTI